MYRLTILLGVSLIASTFAAEIDLPQDLPSSFDEIEANATVLDGNETGPAYFLQDYEEDDSNSSFPSFMDESVNNRSGPELMQLASGHPAPSLYSGRGYMNGGRWYCPGRMRWFRCVKGYFRCQCPGDRRWFGWSISCRAKSFLRCGKPRGSHSCRKWTNCKSCNLRGNPCRSCIPGYVLRNGNCLTKDTNECLTKNGGCEHTCINTDGSYYCKCKIGFKLNSDKRTCKRMSCEEPSSICGGDVRNSDTAQPWSYESYALYSCEADKCNGRKQILDGTYARKCLAKHDNRMLWTEDAPLYGCVDTCSYVKASKRQACGRNVKTFEKCQQLGCCFKEDPPTGTPHCFLNPVKVFLKYGKTYPVVVPTPKSFPQISTEACAFRTLHKSHQTTFAIRHDGKDVKQNVTLQSCLIVDGTMHNTTANEKYDTYKILGAAVREEKVNGRVVGINIPSADLTGIPTAIFSVYPDLKEIKSPRFVVKVKNVVVTPSEKPLCAQCHTECADKGMYESVTHTTDTLKVQSLYINMALLNKMANKTTRTIRLKAQTVVINEDMNLPGSLYLDTTNLIIDRSAAEFITLSSKGVVLKEYKEMVKQSTKPTSTKMNQTT